MKKLNYLLDKITPLWYALGMVYITRHEYRVVFYDNKGSIISSNAPYEILREDGFRAPEMPTQHSSAYFKTEPVPYKNLSEWVQRRVPADTKDVFFPIMGYKYHNMSVPIELIGYIRLIATWEGSKESESDYRVGQIKMQNEVAI